MGQHLGREVDGVDVRGAVLNQHLREVECAGAEIEHDALYGLVERRERSPTPALV